MSTTISPPKTTAEQISEEGAPLLAPTGEYVSVVDVPPLQGGHLLAPPSIETRPGRTVRPREALSSTLPLVLVFIAEHGKEMVLPGYYACVGTMPCADTEYYLLVRWEHRERGRQAEKRVVLAEHIRVLDPEALVLPPSLSVTAVASSGPASALPEDLVRLTPESTTSSTGKGQWSPEGYPQLRHSSKRKT
jgi:hypothetical protein